MPCGLQVLAAVRSQPSDIVILEAATAETPWMEVMERLRRQDPELPIIILAANATADSTLVGLKVGASDCIVKGWDSNLTLLTIYQAVRHYRQLKSAYEEIRLLRARLGRVEAVKR